MKQECLSALCHATSGSVTTFWRLCHANLVEFSLYGAWIPGRDGYKPNPNTKINQPDIWTVANGGDE